MSDATSLEARAAELQREFDASFAQPARAAPSASEEVLLVRVAGHGYAVRLRDIAGVVVRQSVALVPADAPGLLGLMGLRGEVVPVFSLAGSLGYGAEADVPAWVLLCGGESPLGLAFQALEGYVRLQRTALHAEAGPGARPDAARVAQTPAGPRPVVSISDIVARIRGHQSTRRRERGQ